MDRRSTRMSAAVAVLACLCALVLVAPAGAKDCAGADGKPRGKKAARATLCLLNVQREAAGLQRLRPNKQLRRAARAHSRDMVVNGYFDHSSPLGSTLVARVLAAGYVHGGGPFEVRENLGYGSGSLGTPRGIVTAWLASRGHRDNLLAPTMRDAGVGVVPGEPQGGAGATYTVVFGTRGR